MAIVVLGTTAPCAICVVIDVTEAEGLGQDWVPEVGDDQVGRAGVRRTLDYVFEQVIFVRVAGKGVADFAKFNDESVRGVLK